MSYILDALRKSEQDRQPTDLATLTPVQRSRSQRRSNPWLIGLVLLLAGNVVLLLYVTFGPGTAIDPVSSSATTGSAATESLNNNSTGNGTEQLTPMPEAPLSTEESITIRPSAQADDARQLLASLTFTSHVFADDPSLRSVMIDGRVFREGDSPQPGVTLVSITSTGVVLRYRGREMAYNVLEQWEQL